MNSFQTQFNSIEDIKKSYDLRPIENADAIPQRKWKSFSTKPKKKTGGSPVREFIAKLSRGLMLPIAMLPVAGLFLGIGSAIVTQASNNNIEWLKIIGQILYIPGNAIFSNLPVLFCIAIAITFAGDAGVAGLSAFVGWVAFCALQSAFIVAPSVDGGNYHFLFYNFNETMFNAVFTSNVGIQSLQTSVFGGLIVGFIVAVLYNKFKNIQMPQILGFFSGVRFIPIVTFCAMIVLSLLFCLIWPVFGLGLYYLGNYLGQAPYGINSLFFGYIERSLVPFGLHHAFYAPLWYTSAGGTINLSDLMVINGVQAVASAGSLDPITWLQFAQQFGYNGPSSVVGDQTGWMMASTIVGHTVYLKDGSTTILTFDMIDKAFDGVNLGQYMQGKYAFMMFGLPAAAAAITMAAPKGNARKLAFSTVSGAALTSFLTGITEPLEFTFLFLAPALYYGFHAVFCAISFWLMNLLGAHVGMTFSGGAIDFTIYGIIPDAMGAGAHCYWAIAIGAAYIPIYYFGFLFIIKGFDIKTPGREGAENKLMTKKDYLAKKGQVQAEPQKINANVSNAPKLENLNKDQQFAYDVIMAYGGANNIKNVDACITKLRVQVIDQSVVDMDALKQLGARGVVKPSAESVYAVFGTKADFIKNQMNELLPKLK